MENLVQYGALGLSAMMLLVFFRHLDRRDKALAIIADDCHKHSDRIVQCMEGALRRSNESLDKNTTAMTEAAVELRALNRWRDQHGDTFLNSISKRAQA